MSGVVGNSTLLLSVWTLVDSTTLMGGKLILFSFNFQRMCLCDTTYTDFDKPKTYFSTYA